uniref:MD-2-related lipid-recognition domain-containing protein n=1 Tax=Anopheles farauti TaxID=69004 RepID=A0A182QQG3_9DIPT
MNVPSYRHIANIVLFCAVGKLLFLTVMQPQCAAQMNRKSPKGNVSHKLRITSIECIDAPYKLTHLNYCKMVQFPNGTVGLNTSVHIPIVLNYFEVTVKVYYKYTTYRPFMIDWSIELCQAERIGKFNPTTAIVMKIIEDSVPEFYYPCPHGNRTYATFWTFEPSYIPATLPSGNYRLDVFFRDATFSKLYAIRMECVMRRQGLIG